MYFSGRLFIYIYNDNINESCLSNDKLPLNKKGSNLFSKNILIFLDVISHASNGPKDTGNTKPNLKKSYNFDQGLNDLRRKNPFNLNSFFLNINSVTNKFIDIMEKK